MSMNYECKVETKSSIRRQLTISIKPDTIKGFIEQQLSSLQKTAKLPGFRQGKVPLHMIKQYYMEDVKSKVFSNVIRETYIKALEDNKIEPVGMPEIQPTKGADLNEGEDLEFTAMVEIFPEVKVKDLNKLTVARPMSDVTDEDIEASLNNLRENNAEMIVDAGNQGPAKEGDYLELTFKGTVEGKTRDNLKGDNRLVQIGGGQYMKEFEHALVGMKKGESKSFPVKFPAEFGEPSLAGKEVQFDVTVHEFKKKQLPELNDDFAKRFKMETGLELRKKVVETLTEDRKREATEKLKENTLRVLVEHHEFEVPKALVRQQIEYLVKENADYLMKNGFTEKMVRDYLEKNRQQLEKRAEEQVRASLLLDRIAEDQSIKVEGADLEHEFTKVSQRVNIPTEQVKQLYEKDQSALRQLRFKIKEERTIEYILGQVKTVDEKPAKK